MTAEQNIRHEAAEKIRDWVANLRPCPRANRTVTDYSEGYSDGLAVGARMAANLIDPPTRRR